MKSKCKYISQLTEDDFRAMFGRIVESDASKYKFEIEDGVGADPYNESYRECIVSAKHPPNEEILSIYFYGDFKFDVDCQRPLNIKAGVNTTEFCGIQHEVLKYMIETFGEEYAEDYLKYFVTNITAEAEKASDALCKLHNLISFEYADASELDDITLEKVFKERYAYFYDEKGIAISSSRAEEVKDRWIKKQRENPTIYNEIERIIDNILDESYREVAAVKKLVNDIVEEVKNKKSGISC